jgi:hypothetical protein
MPHRSDDDVLKNYLDGDRLKVIPRKRNRKMVVLNWLVQRFEYGVDYAEAEVNALIAEAHPDYATLRRELYDAYLMDRENGVYRRRETGIAGGET